MNDQEMRDLVASYPIARLATIDPDGRPNVVPFVFALDGDDVLAVVDRKPKRTTALRRLENIARDARVTVLVDHYDDDWDELWWVRIRGTARIVESGEELTRAVSLLRAKYSQYDIIETEEIAVVIHAKEWTGWRMRPKELKRE